jgi:hypothetical protein
MRKKMSKVVSVVVDDILIAVKSFADMEEDDE